MDERTLFDRFHDALDAEPRPGAFERMRFAMSKNQPVVLEKRPALQTRWPKMGLRIAAVMTAVVVAFALVAAFIAGHPGLVGTAPAAPDPNVKAYQAMVYSDHDAVNTVNFNHTCSSVQDAGCPAADDAEIAALQNWIGDLKSFRTPSQFVVLDGQLRAHLNETIAELNLITVYQKANNENAFIVASQAEFFEEVWSNAAMLAFEGTSPRVAGTYHDAFRLARQALDACVNNNPAPADIGCDAIRLGRVCAGSAHARDCGLEVQNAETQIQTLLIALLQNPAPRSLTTKNAQVMSDLAKADSALLAITDALLNGDAGKMATASNSYDAYIFAADSDAGAIGNP
jgi:hypothetical protein